MFVLKGIGLGAIEKPHLGCLYSRNYLQMTCKVWTQANLLQCRSDFWIRHHLWIQPHRLWWSTHYLCMKCRFTLTVISDIIPNVINNLLGFCWQILLAQQGLASFSAQILMPPDQNHPRSVVLWNYRFWVLAFFISFPQVKNPWYSLWKSRGKVPLMSPSV